MLLLQIVPRGQHETVHNDLCHVTFCLLHMIQNDDSAICFFRYCLRVFFIDILYGSDGVIRLAEVEQS